MTTLALETIYDALRQRFADEGPTGVTFAFGFRAAAEHTAGANARVVLVPGDDSGNAGDMFPPDSVTARDDAGSRILGRQQQLCQFLITAPGDLNDAENELSQWRNTMLLRHQVWRALQLTCETQFAILTEKYATAATRLSDVTVEMVVGVYDQITDEPSGTSFVQASGLVDEIQGDTTESFPAP
jgi:hypothetical protein